MENELQGIDGEREIVVNNVGKMIGEEKVIQEMVNGKDVYLSIDKDLQITAYHILEQNLAGIIASNLINAKSFDKTHISDTSDIRIPIYDVYTALVDNSVIQLDDFYRADATELERHIAELLQEKKKEVLAALKEELLDGNTDYHHLSEKMQEYIAYITDKIEILNMDSVDREDEVYKRWKAKSGISVKEFLTYAIENGWIAVGVIDSERGYFTTDEMFDLMIESMVLSIMILAIKVLLMTVAKTWMDKSLLNVLLPKYRQKMIRAILEKAITISMVLLRERLRFK